MGKPVVPKKSQIFLYEKGLLILGEISRSAHFFPKKRRLTSYSMWRLFYDILHDNKPSNLNLSFISEQHNYHTRNASSQRLQICPFRINIRKFCPSVIGTYYWNDIPQSIRNKSSKQLFKYALQQYYFAQYWYLSNLCTCACVCIVLYVCTY